MTDAEQYTVAQAAYLAGLIDGEGAIVVSRSEGKGGRSIVYQPFISISNTEVGMIDWLCDTFGGTRTRYTAKQTPRNSWKPIHKWQVTGTNIDRICHIVLPYTTIKRPQIEVMLELRATYNKRGCHSKHNGAGLSREVLAIREDCHQRLKLLHNRTGRS